MPYTKQTEFARGFKQAKRRDDDIAIVNAGLRIDIDPSDLIVKDAAFAFGGMAPVPLMARKASKVAIGAKWEPKLLHSIQSALMEVGCLNFCSFVSKDRYNLPTFPCNRTCL